jgi:hypothetical protein
LVWGGIKRAPYLQPTKDLEHSIGIAWEVDSGDGGEIWYGKGSLDKKAVGVHQGAAPTGGNRYYVKIEGLEPETEYQFRLMILSIR